MSRFNYDIDTDAAGGPAVPAAAPVPLSGGGGNPPPAPVAPKGYAVTTPQQRSDWNDFLDYAGKQSGANLTDPKQQAALLASYKKTNPNFSVTADQIPNIQYEAYQLRKGNSFGNLGAKELGYIRQGMNPNFLNTDTGNIGKLYYPREGSYGTDLENYYNSKFNPSAATPPTAAGSPPASSPAPAVAASSKPGAAVPSVYDNHDTALKRTNQLAGLPGNSFLHGRGDALINASYVPTTDTKSFKDSAVQATKKQGLDPNMFWASAAEEGATGLVANKQGNITTDPNIDLDGKYPVSGFTNFGVDHFHDDFKTLVSRGYLPKDFDYQKSVHTNERGEKVNSGDFKSVEDALQAKGAYIRMHQDDLDNWAKQSEVQLSPAARQFFTYVSYNGGPGTAHKMINYYKSNGLLDGDKFLQNAPGEKVDPGGSYGKVLPRWQMAQLMTKEKLFDQ